MRKNAERLLDISEAIAKIERYAILGKAKFEEDETDSNLDFISISSHR